jgi:hypothetical protein
MDNLEYAVDRYHDLVKEAESRRSHTGRPGSHTPVAPMMRALLLVVGALLINLGTRIIASCEAASARMSGEEASGGRPG